MTKLNITSFNTYYYGDYLTCVRKWQDANSGVLGLCPKSWVDMTPAQKWAALRILSRRPGYQPNWLSPDLWRSLKAQLVQVSFDDETELLAPSTYEESPLEQAYRESISGKAPQSFREEGPWGSYVEDAPGDERMGFDEQVNAAIKEAKSHDWCQE